MTPHLFPTSMEMEFSKLMAVLNFWLWEALVFLFYFKINLLLLLFYCCDISVKLIPWQSLQISSLEWCLQVRTFRGHTNEKNFVGLTVNSEYIACGSETNEVFVYHKVSNIRSSSLPPFNLETKLSFGVHFAGNLQACDST